MRPIPPVRIVPLFAAWILASACDSPSATGGIVAVDAVVVGSVLDANSAPVEDATVRFRLWFPGTACTEPPDLTVGSTFSTDSEGRYRARLSQMNVPETTYCIRVVATRGTKSDSLDLPAVQFREGSSPDTTFAEPVVF